MQKSPSFSLRVWPGGGLHNFFTPSATCNARVVSAHPGHSITACSVCWWPVRGRGPAAGYLGSDAWSSSLLFCRPQGQGSEPVLTPAPCSSMAVHVPGCWLAGQPPSQAHTNPTCWHPSTLGRRHHPMDGCHAGACEAGAGPPQILPHASVGGRRHSNPIGVCYVLARGRGANSLHLLHPSSTAEFLWRPRATPEFTRGSALAHGWACQQHCLG